ncbi:MAG: phosphate ABC transporter substrate-binding protein [Gammaproteobacteria bacterium]|nr:phosphate ABC transporter substrate-binding protein [Gammaproteobacteria bacterium]
MTQLKRLLALAILAASSGLAVAGNVAIITHPGSSAVGITAEEAANIYLGKTGVFGKGSSVKPVDQKPGTPAHTKFYKEVLNKSDQQFKAHWSRIMFSGKGRPPQELDSDIAVKNWVASNPNSIGYVDGSVLDNSVKILLIIP